MSVSLQVRAAAELERRRRAQLKGSDKDSYRADKLTYRQVARAKQLPPDGDWHTWLIRSGRGFGKTWTGANWVIERALLHPEHPIALIGQTKADVRDTMIEVGDSSILKQSPDWFKPDYQPSKRRIVWPNGAIAMIYSGDEPDQLRGPQHGAAWVDELAKFKYPQETWDNLEFGLRLGQRPQILVTTTPRGIPIMKALIKDVGTISVSGSTYENRDHLAPAFLARMAAKYEGTTLGRQEIHGEILEDVPGALWKRAIIDPYRVNQAPDLWRLVIGVDPAASANGDETGIIASGITGDRDNPYGFVLRDSSLQGSPLEWARVAVAAYHEFKADVIVAEKNNGGDMVEQTILTVDPTVNVKLVSATRGKHTRAEPVAALYEQGRIHHVGTFPELEDQMCTWLPDDPKAMSPDRMDALVWALSEMILEPRTLGIY